MAVVGVVMVGIFGHIRLVRWPRLDRAVQAGDWPAAGAALAGRFVVYVPFGEGVGVSKRLSDDERKRHQDEFLEERADVFLLEERRPEVGYRLLDDSDEAHTIVSVQSAIVPA